MKHLDLKYSKVTTVVIDAEYQDQRLDNYLFRVLKTVPRSYIYRIIRKGEVRINKKRITPDQRLQAGDMLRIPPVQVTVNTTTPPKPTPRLIKLIEDSILYEDEALMVINKPAGFAVHGGSGIHIGVIEALREMRPHARFLELVHRLDRDTSGCLMIAKKSSCLKELHALLRQNQVKKIYYALLKGYWRGGNEQRVTAPLRKNILSSGERIVKVDPTGKPAVTTFIPIKRYPSATLAEVHLETGRTHQIRVHALYLKQPIVGDEKYGDSLVNKQFHQMGCKRMMLHSSRLAFTLPSKKQLIEITAPTDLHWNQFLHTLNK